MIPRHNNRIHSDTKKRCSFVALLPIIGDVKRYAAGDTGQEKAGLNPVKIAEILSSEFHFDPTSSRETLGYGGGDLNQALKDTVEACK